MLNIHIIRPPLFYRSYYISWILSSKNPYYVVFSQPQVTSLTLATVFPPKYFLKYSQCYLMRETKFHIHTFFSNVFISELNLVFSY
jgi:hypothetical protein